MFQLSLLADYIEKYKDADGNKTYLYGSVWTEFAKAGLTNVFFYLTIAVAVLLVAVGFFVKYKKEEQFASYVKISIALAVGYLVAVGAVLASLEFFEIYEKGYVFEYVFYPSIVLAATVVLGIAAIYVASLYNEKAYKTTKLVALCVIGAAFVAFLVCLGIYSASGSADENNGTQITLTENVLLYVSALVVVGLIVALAFLSDKNGNFQFDSKSISYAAILIAMSFALSYIKFFELPQGGSLTPASLLPLMVYAYMFGSKKGVFAAFIYGTLQAFQDPWLVHPAQFLLDYSVAFSAIGLAGIFSSLKLFDNKPQVQFTLGAIVASSLRYISHVLSGIFAFSEYAGEEGAVIYSLTYNSFVFIDIAIAIVVGIFLFSSKSFVKQARKFNALPKKKVEAEA